jgi:hypothetical protein
MCSRKLLKKLLGLMNFGVLIVDEVGLVLHEQTGDGGV